MQVTKTHFKNYIEQQENDWFEKFSPYITRSNTIKVGNGLGHSSELIRPYTQRFTILDVQTFPLTVNADKVEIYDGIHIPYPNKSFDTCICIFTLHHIPNNRSYFKELIRVTSKRIILLEETYDNVFQKLHLYLRDWIVNLRAGQSSDLHWKSYFSRRELNKLIKENNLTEVHRITKKHKSYIKELLILDLN